MASRAALWSGSAASGHAPVRPPVRRTWCVRLCAAAAAALLAGGCLEAPDGEPIRTEVVLGGLGDSPGRFTYPRAIDTDGQTLWVVDKSARIQRLDPETGACLSVWRMPLSENGKPVGITIAPGPDGTDAIYVPDTHYHRVMIYALPALPESFTSPRGRQTPIAPSEKVSPALLASFGSYGEGPGQFIYPTDVAVLTAEDGRTVERVYVSEYGGNDRVSVFDASHTYLFSFGSFGSSGSASAVQFDRPQALCLDRGRDELLVADSRNHRIGRFTPDGELIGWIGGPGPVGDGPGRLKYPYGMCLLDDGTLLVAEYGNNRVQRLDVETGAGLGTWGLAGRGDGELAAPWSVTVMDRRTFVLDSGNNRVLGMATPRRIR